MPSAVRKPRPIIWTYSISLLVGLARMMQRTSQSMPVVRQPTLQTTFTSPAWKRLAMRALDRLGVGVDVFRGDAGSLKLRLEMLGVGPIDRKAKRRAIPSLRLPRLDDIGDQLRLVDSSGEVALVVVARHRPNAFKVRGSRREGADGDSTLSH